MFQKLTGKRLVDFCHMPDKVLAIGVPDPDEVGVG
jgi:hypothetical protein